jgi:hypothetical protein
LFGPGLRGARVIEESTLWLLPARSASPRRHGVRYQSKTRYVIGPTALDIDRIAIDLLKVVARRPKAQDGAFYPPSRQAIGAVMLVIDTDSGAIVLDHSQARFSMRIDGS